MISQHRRSRFYRPHRSRCERAAQIRFCLFPKWASTSREYLFFCRITVFCLQAGGAAHICGRVRSADVRPAPPSALQPDSSIRSIHTLSLIHIYTKGGRPRDVPVDRKIQENILHDLIVYLRSNGKKSKDYLICDNHKHSVKKEKALSLIHI